MKKVLSVVLTLFLTVGVFLQNGVDVKVAAADELSSDLQISSDTEYGQYYSDVSRFPDGNEEIVIDGGNFSDFSGDVTNIGSFEGRDNTVKIGSAEGTQVSYRINLDSSAKYRIKINYYALSNRSNNIQYGIKLNGEYPFSGCEQLTLSKVFQNTVNEFLTDLRGNQIRPSQTQVMTWQSAYVTDQQGITNNPYVFAFRNTGDILTVVSEMTDMVIDSIVLTPVSETEPYVDYAAKFDKNSDVSCDSIFLQGENSTYISDPSIAPMSDRSSAATFPSDAVRTMYNYVGSYNWQTQGQWISWEFTVPQDGVYNIGMRVRQNFQRGYATNRRIYIDGEVPFSELNSFEYEYSNKWYLKILGGDERYEFYLTKGTHTISMEVVPGYTSEIYASLKENVYKLNSIYRSIIMVTGTTPDTYRDYSLEEEIPALTESMSQEYEALKTEFSKLESVYGGRDSDTAKLEQMIVQLKSFLDDTETIPSRLSSFSDNISALSSWMVRLKDQPLDIDYIEIVPSGGSFRRVSPRFQESICFAAKQFAGSFVTDYNLISAGTEKKENINVWINLGRDQVQLINEITENKFNSNHDFSVTVRLVQGSIIQATYAGTGPDVALYIGSDQPVNLAVRGALVDMTSFPDYDDVVKRFSSQAVVPYKFSGGTYALPVTGMFNMMFYRSDIFESLNLSVPQTWDDLYAVLPTLQRNNMNIGLPKVVMDGTTGLSASASSIFDTLLLQKNQSYFGSDMTKTNFDSAEALDSFKEWTGYYTEFGVPVDYDFYNRFRTGEIPIGIDTYAMYNKLYVGAPEITGKWQMVEIPGTVQSDGSLSRATSVTGTAAVIFNNGCNADNAWEFVKWFTSTDIQAEYGRSIEALLGAASRYDTANLEAIKQHPWTNVQQKQLLSQWSNAVGIPQVPASYYISRNLYNAYRRVTIYNSNPRETLYKYNVEINREIERKNTEFGLTGLKGGTE